MRVQEENALFLQRLTLHHYRNYQHVELVTDRNVNIFVGPNAQGKTNLLESIYVLALTKSHRTHHDKELIQWEGESALLQGDVEKNMVHIPLIWLFPPKGKKQKLTDLNKKTKPIHWRIECGIICS